MIDCSDEDIHCLPPLTDEDINLLYDCLPSTDENSETGDSSGGTADPETPRADRVLGKRRRDRRLGSDNGRRTNSSPMIDTTRVCETGLPAQITISKMFDIDAAGAVTNVTQPRGGLCFDITKKVKDFEVWLNHVWGSAPRRVNICGGGLYAFLASEPTPSNLIMIRRRKTGQSIWLVTYYGPYSSDSHTITSDFANLCIQNISFLKKMSVAFSFTEIFKATVNMSLEIAHLLKPCLGFRRDQHRSEYALPEYERQDAFTVEDRVDDFLYSYRLALFRYQEIFVSYISDVELQKRLIRTGRDSVPSSVNLLYKVDKDALVEVEAKISMFDDTAKAQFRDRVLYYLDYHLDNGLVPKLSNGNY